MQRLAVRGGLGQCGPVCEDGLCVCACERSGVGMCFGGGLARETGGYIARRCSRSTSNARPMREAVKIKEKGLFTLTRAHKHARTCA